MKRQAEELFLIYISVILVSCASQTIPAAVPATEASRAELTSLPLRSDTPLATSTIVLTPTPTPAPNPTLSPLLRESEIRRLLENDPDCKPPCFLGIIPKQTTVGEIETIFLHFGLPLADGPVSVYYLQPHPKAELPPTTSFYIRNDQVESITIDIEPSNEFEWSLYSPANMLRRFGPPSQVTFGLQVIHEPSPTPGKGWYILTFFYDDLEGVIQYGNPEIRLGKLITVCPNTDTFDSTRLWLGKSPGHPPSPSTGGPLEKVTSFTLESFTEYLLLEPEACFDLKAEAIPIY